MLTLRVSWSEEQLGHFSWTWASPQPSPADMQCIFYVSFMATDYWPHRCGNGGHCHNCSFLWESHQFHLSSAPKCPVAKTDAVFEVNRAGSSTAVILSFVKHMLFLDALSQWQEYTLNTADTTINIPCLEIELIWILMLVRQQVCSYPIKHQFRVFISTFPIGNRSQTRRSGQRLCS